METNKEKEEAITKLLSDQDLLVVREVLDVNHDPHPYTIGPAHIKYSNDHHGGMLGTETIENVNCAYSRCNLPHSSHTSDNVCFLQLIRNGTQEEVNKTLKLVFDTLGESFIDGFSFIETKEKFRFLDNEQDETKKTN